MRYSAEHKAETRERLLASSGALAKQQGFAVTGVDALMKTIGLTGAADDAVAAARIELGLVRQQLDVDRARLANADALGLSDTQRVQLSTQIEEGSAGVAEQERAVTRALRDRLALARDIEQALLGLSDAAAAQDTALQEAERELAPRVAAHQNAMYLDARLFARIAAVHEARAQLGLSPEQLRLVERIHMDFVMAGARLSEADRARVAA